MDKAIALKNVKKLPAGLTADQVRQELSTPKLFSRNGGGVFRKEDIEFMVVVYLELDKCKSVDGQLRRPRDRKVEITDTNARDVRDGFVKKLSIGYENGGTVLTLTPGEYNQLVSLVLSDHCDDMVLNRCEKCLRLSCSFAATCSVCGGNMREETH